MLKHLVSVSLVAVLGPTLPSHLIAAQQPLRAVSVETLGSEMPGGTGGISVDSRGNVYVADFGSRLGPGGTGGNRVFVMSPEGEWRVFAEGFRGASGNEFDSNGNLFQSNIGIGIISKVTPGGEISRFAGGVQAPVGIVSDADDNLYVANCGSNSIQFISSAGESSRFVGSPLLNCPNGIAFGSDGNLYVANFSNGDVVKVTLDGDVSVLATLPGGNNGHLIHHDGYLYVIDRSGHQIWTVSLDGDVELLAGSGERGRDDGDPMQATFSLPNDIGISPDGRTLYVNDVAPTDTPNNVLAPMIVRAIRVVQQ